MSVEDIKNINFNNVRLFHDRQGLGYSRLVDIETGEASKLIHGAPHPIDGLAPSVARIEAKENEIVAHINGAEYVATRE